MKKLFLGLAALLVSLFLAPVFPTEASTLEYNWSDSYINVGYDYIEGAAVDNEGNIYVVGSFSDDQADLDPTGGVAYFATVGEDDVYITKLNKDGAYLWTKTFGGTGFDYPYAGVEIGPDGNIYTGGYYQGANTDFDPGPATDLRSSAGTSVDGFISVFDPNGNFIRAYTTAASGSDTIFGISFDSADSLYYTGRFTGSNVDLDMTSGTDTYSSAGSGDMFIGKISQDGSYQWTKVIGGNNFVGPSDVQINSLDEVVVIGSFNGTNIDFDPGAGTSVQSTAGGYDGFILKLNTDGGFVYVHKIGGTGADLVQGMAIDVNDYLYVVAHFNGTVDFNPGAGTDTKVSAGSSDGAVIKFDSQGTYLWTQTFGGSSSDSLYDLAVDPLGDVYAVGYALGTFDADPTSGTDMRTVASDYPNLMLVLNGDGSYENTYIWAITPYSYAYRIVGHQNNLYVLGQYGLTGVDLNFINGDDNRGFITEYEGFLTKLTIPMPTAPGDSFSQPSAASSQSCDAVQPHTSPHLFQAVAKSNEVTLYFSPLNDNVSSYVFGYGYTFDDQWRFGATFEGNYPGVMSQTIRDLEPNTEYFFAVRGQNGCAAGDWGNKATVKTLKKGSKASKVVHFN